MIEHQRIRIVRRAIKFVAALWGVYGLLFLIMIAATFPFMAIEHVFDVALPSSHTPKTSAPRSFAGTMFGLVLVLIPMALVGSAWLVWYRYSPLAVRCTCGVLAWWVGLIMTNWVESAELFFTVAVGLAFGSVWLSRWLCRFLFPPEPPVIKSTGTAEV